MDFWLIGDETVSWESKVLCALDVMEYAEQMSNGWPDPFMFAEPGCPVPVFTAEVFDSDLLWQC